MKPYQRYLTARFATVVAKSSFDYISKAPGTWLIVGDRRSEIAADIQLIMERYGIGIGVLVLHLQQINAGHIPTRITVNGRVQNLAQPTRCLNGAEGERVLSIPIRRYRSDFGRLARLNVAKPRSLWEASRIVTHERDCNPCFYCSCPETNPAEVIVDLEGPRHGLSRHYSFGFTFAPFGNPLSVVHFLVWDRARRPLNMNRVPMTVSDLVKLTREINLSIRTFFAETSICQFPVIDGISNGWAGNTIYHQHFQFFQPEHSVPLARGRPLGRKAVICRDDVTVHRLCWPAPVYRVRADDALNTGLVGNDLAGIWRLLGGSRKVPYKPFADGYTPTQGEKVHAHTQNLYVPGCHLGDTAYLMLRDRERINFRPGAENYVNRARAFRAQRKDNIGVLEATGTLIVDDAASFQEMKQWTPTDISRQMRMMAAAIAPEERKVAEFENTIRDLFPP
ncbi:MAG TPA: hypothetical protein P5205_11715 [Candidatus Paceibacterota bacterium]|nr:hypothetical protein [Verrucomicrobiota bacterium]HSA11026.1 hypothetical protein [Candidatus Paceibacterota bacterium]